MIFERQPEIIYAVYFSFIVANILMVPFGYLAIKASSQMLRVPKNILMPAILMFAIIGAFAINNSVFDVGVCGIMGMIGYFMEANGYPVAPIVLGLVLGPDPGAEFHDQHDQVRLGSDPLFYAAHQRHSGHDDHHYMALPRSWPLSWKRPRRTEPLDAVKKWHPTINLLHSYKYFEFIVLKCFINAVKLLHLSAFCSPKPSLPEKAPQSNRPT